MNNNTITAQKNIFIKDSNSIYFGTETLTKTAKSCNATAKKVGKAFKEFRKNHPSLYHAIKWAAVVTAVVVGVGFLASNPAGWATAVGLTGVIALAHLGIIPLTATSWYIATPVITFAAMFIYSQIQKGIDRYLGVDKQKISSQLVNLITATNDALELLVLKPFALPQAIAFKIKGIIKTVIADILVVPSIISDVTGFKKYFDLKNSVKLIRESAALDNGISGALIWKNLSIETFIFTLSGFTKTAFGIGNSNKNTTGMAKTINYENSTNSHINNSNSIMENSDIQVLLDKHRKALIEASRQHLNCGKKTEVETNNDLTSSEKASYSSDLSTGSASDSTKLNESKKSLNFKQIPLENRCVIS